MMPPSLRRAAVAVVTLAAVGCSGRVPEQTYPAGDEAMARLDALVETAANVAGGDYEPPVYELRALCDPETWEHGADQVRAVVEPWPRGEPLTAEETDELADEIREALDEPAVVFPPPVEDAERHDTDPDPAAPPVWKVGYADGAAWLDLTPYDIRALAAVEAGSAVGSDRVVSDGRDCDDQRRGAEELSTPGPTEG